MLDCRKRAVAALVMTASLSLAGCAGSSMLGGSAGTVATTATSPAASGEGTASASRKVAAGLAPVSASASQTSPQGADASARPAGSKLQLVRSLRAKGDRTRALAEAEKARAEKPADRELAREVGLLALELGQPDKARKALEAANDPAAPDWRTLSALGTAHATAGNQREAQAHFTRALALKPDHQPTLNNLALSYVLDGNLAKAEKTLKAASRGEDAKKVQENLAIVLALAGRHDDAIQVARGVMPKEVAEANIAYLRTITKQGG